MHVKFTKDFDFSPAAKNGHVTIAYKVGAEENVTRECVKAAAAVDAIERNAEVDALLAEDAPAAAEAEVPAASGNGKANRRG